MTAKVLFTGKTHNTNGRNGAARSSDGFLDIKLPQSHPAAENLFGAAWSACYMGAIGHAASQRKVKLPADMAVDAEIRLNLDGDAFFLTARLDVGLPGLDREVAQELIHAAHEICPYSKAIRGNIAVETNLV
ncbi:MAG TPA: Ohr family peroxiredoxin [Rhodoblastus sp.]|nr:Ohr family peroxiredoxin [Rhodoblastus sp.]